MINKVVVGICGSLLTVLLLWSFYETGTDKSLPDNMKRKSWIIFIVIAAMICVACLKLTGRGFPYKLPPQSITAPTPD